MKIYRFVLWFFLIGVLALSNPVRAGQRSAALRVAAASDLRRAFGALCPQFEAATGVKVTVVFGSTGLLTKQAENGAPFDLLFAANESYIQDLERKGKIVPGTRSLYAVGRLALWTQKGRPHPASLTDLTKPAYQRIAIANPEHAPYGAAAKEALEKAGVWRRVAPERIVYGENVQQTLQYAQTGNADAALVALSLAVGSNGMYHLVPETLHRSLRQAAGVLIQSRQATRARKFLAFVRGGKGQAILRRYGFSPPPKGR